MTAIACLVDGINVRGRRLWPRSSACARAGDGQDIPDLPEVQGDKIGNGMDAGSGQFLDRFAADTPDDAHRQVSMSPSSFTRVSEIAHARHSWIILGQAIGQLGDCLVGPRLTHVGILA